MKRRVIEASSMGQSLVAKIDKELKTLQADLETLDDTDEELFDECDFTDLLEEVTAARMFLAHRR